MEKLNEIILEDSYRVYYGQLFVADGKIIRCDIMGTVADLKEKLNAKEIKNCDISSRYTNQLKKEK
jgi:hypothetical protein